MGEVLYMYDYFLQQHNQLDPNLELRDSKASTECNFEVWRNVRQLRQQLGPFRNTLFACDEAFQQKPYNTCSPVSCI